MSFVGTWGFRSLINDRDLLTPYGNLELQTGLLVLELAEPRRIHGTLEVLDRKLVVVGHCTDRQPNELRLDCFGDENEKEPVSRAVGWVVPRSIGGSRRIETLVGSIALQTSGLIASWYAVRDPVAHTENGFTGYGGGACLL